MGNGEWEMGNGEWGIKIITNAQCPLTTHFRGMGNGKWGMGNGEWGIKIITNAQCPMPNAQCPITNYLPKTSIRTGATPLPIMPKMRAAATERSITRPRMNGPRSLIRTTTERPLRVLVTRTFVPKGK
jgi:hypothetical protein